MYTAPPGPATKTRGPCCDTAGAKLIKIAELLLSRDASVVYHDPYVPRIHHELEGWQMESVPDVMDCVRDADAVVIVTNHTSYDYPAILEQARFTPQEERGMSLFSIAQKGNCAACHTLNADSREPRDSLFTDFEFHALGVPRNADIAQDSQFDLLILSSLYGACLMVTSDSFLMHAAHLVLPDHTYLERWEDALAEFQGR